MHLTVSSDLLGAGLMVLGAGLMVLGAGLMVLGAGLMSAILKLRDWGQGFRWCASYGGILGSIGGRLPVAYPWVSMGAGLLPPPPPAGGVKQAGFLVGG